MTDPKEVAERFVRAFHDAVGDRLEAAALFGSAARGEWIEDVSDVNVLLLLDDIDAPVLERAAQTVWDAVGGGITPLVMERAEWRQAADVFAVEVSDMKDAVIPLFGDDPVATLEVLPAKLRLQAERELRGKLLHLHGAMMMCAGDAPRLGEVLMHALPSFTTYLRAALRLAGQNAPPGSREVIEEGCRLCGADPSPFLRILEARLAREELQVSLSDPLADEFNTAAAMLAAHIDAQGG